MHPDLLRGVALALAYAELLEKGASHLDALTALADHEGTTIQAIEDALLAAGRKVPLQ